MGFASDGVSIPGGVPPIGVGRENPYDGGVNDQGIELARHSMQSRELVPVGNHRPRLNLDVTRYPFQPANEREPGVGTMFGKVMQVLTNFLQTPQPTRGDNKPTREERETFLMGIPGLPPDAEARGLNFEPVDQDGVSHVDTGFVEDIVAAVGGYPQPLINTGDKGLTGNSDISKQVQDYPTNEHDTLSAYRASWPSSRVDQAPVISRNIVLAQLAGAGSFLGELNIPDGAITARITYTSGVPGVSVNDLWFNFSSQATIPTAANQPGGGTSGFITQATILNDGNMLNPDQSTRYLVKGKRAISFACSNVCTVSVHFYSQA